MKKSLFLAFSISFYGFCFGQLSNYHHEYTYLSHPSSIQFEGRNSVNGLLSSSFKDGSRRTNYGYFHQTENQKWRVGATTNLYYSGNPHKYRSYNAQVIANRNIYKSEVRSLVGGLSLGMPLQSRNTAYFYIYYIGNVGLSYSGKFLEGTVTYQLITLGLSNNGSTKNYSSYQNVSGFVGLKNNIGSTQLSTRIGFFNDYSLTFGQQLKLKNGINFGYGFGYSHYQFNAGYQTGRWNFNVTYGRMGSNLEPEVSTFSVKFKF